MAFISLQLPPGLYRTGTDYASKGRWFNANLWRWYSGEQRGVGGWVQRSTGSVTGKGRAIITWKDNGDKSWCAIGTNTNLYAMTTGGYLYDITPVGFTPGSEFASTNAPYGAGVYGSGPYGRGSPTGTVTQDAGIWSLDTFGQYLNGVMSQDGTIYQWQLNVSNKAVAVANAPTARSIVVTSERILMALGAAGNPRLIQWSDKENNTVWTETVTNYAGQFPLQTVGKILCGRKIKGGVLILTSVDAWFATFIGQPLVYGFENVGTQCGIVAQNASVVVDTQAYWMSFNGFWNFNGGFTQRMNCDVHDYVFSDINREQLSLISAVHISDYSEIWWFYPSANYIGNNRYVVYNYAETHWSFGSLARLSGADRGALPYVVMVDGNGVVWDHERGNDHGGVTPFVQSGPFEIGSGDNTVMVDRIIPDEKSLGDVTVTFKTHIHPMDAQASYGPYSMTALTDCRFRCAPVRRRRRRRCRDWHGPRPFAGG